jgi:formylglycine-generating enzyme required for sulfatase activity
VVRGENFCQQCGHGQAARAQETVVGACYHCGTSWRSGWLFCKTCGLDRERALLRSTSLPAPPAAVQRSPADELPEVEKVFCKRCGTVAKPYSRFCEGCGGTIEAPKDAPTTGKLRTPPAAASLRTQIDASSQHLHYTEPVAAPRYEARTTQSDPPPPPKIVRHLSPEAARRPTVAFVEAGQTGDLAGRNEPHTEALEPGERIAASVHAPRYDTAAEAPARSRVRGWSQRLAYQIPRQLDRRSPWPLIGLVMMVLLAATTALWSWRGGAKRNLLPPPDPALASTDASPAASSQTTGESAGLPTPPPVSPSVTAAPSLSPAPGTTVPAGMVHVPGGTFEMGRNGGDEAERPVHKVTVKPFLMDRTEVTNEAYLRFIEATSRPAPAGWVEGRFPAGAERLPVVNVTWEDANAFAKWAGKRLPTETEWEFAARGTDGRLYPWGPKWESANANAGNGVEGRLVEVGRFESGASPYGVLDLCGNAWEWTASKLLRYSNRTEIAPGIVVRGGAFNANRETAMATYRGVLQPDKAYERTGFRCVRDVVETNSR